MSHPNITLYHANWSFCSQMVRVALCEKGFSYDKHHIKLCDQYPEGENIDKEYLSIYHQHSYLKLLVYFQNQHRDLSASDCRTL